MKWVTWGIIIIGVGLGGCGGVKKGGAWHLLPAPCAAGLNGVARLPSGEVWVAGEEGTLMVYKHEKWDRPTIFLNTDVLALCRAPNNDLWAGLGYGRLLRYNGEAWLEVSQPYSAENITVMFFTADGTGYATGEGGDVLRCSGSSWEKICTAPAPIIGLGVDGAGNLRAFGNNLFWIYDGASWRPEDMGVDFVARGFALSAEGELWSFNQNNCFRLRENWQGLGNPGLKAMWAAAFPAAACGWAVGDGGAIIRWDGQRWQRENSPTTSDLRAIDFSGPNEGWAAGAAGTVLHYY